MSPTRARLQAAVRAIRQFLRENPSVRVIRYERGTQPNARSIVGHTDDGRRFAIGYMNGRTAS